MRNVIATLALVLSGALITLSAAAQQTSLPAAAPQTPAIKTTVGEVVLDIIVRDKKGKPIPDVKPEELSVFDDGARQNLTSFRLVQGSEAITQSGQKARLDPLRQVRLVTLAFDAMTEAAQRKTARKAALDLINGEQGTNVFYSVVAINTRLLVLQQFTKDRAALTEAVDRATAGLAAGRLISESERIKGDLKRYLNGQTVNGADPNTNTLAAATQTASQPVTNGDQAVQARLISIMLDMLRMDATMSTEDARLSISALQSLVQGLQLMPGRKSILYFTTGMYVLPQLDELFRSLMSMANRANVTFYSVDTRGVMAGYSADTRDVATGGQNSDSASQLSGALSASATTTGLSSATTAGHRTQGAVTKEEVMASDNAETSMRANLQLPIRDLAESTGGFLIGDSNDLRVPLRHVNEEISSYYELSYNPHVENYDGSFRKIKVDTDRKDLVIHARNGYFALPPEVRASGMLPFELPLLKAISDGKISGDVKFRSGAVLLQPKSEGTDLTVLVELPMHELQPKTDPAKKTLSVHCSLAALVKDAKGEVVQKLSRDRSFQVTPEQLKMGNFVDKMTVTLPPGKYTLESAVMDHESGKIGTERSEFTVAAKAKGVGISSLTLVRSFTPNAKGLDPSEPFQFQGASITPTLDGSVPKAPDAVLRLFFVVYQDSSISSKPTMEIEFLQNGKSLTKAPLPLPDADAQGRIPYVMSVPAAAIPAGSYEIHATARQGDTTAVTTIPVTIGAM